MSESTQSQRIQEAELTPSPELWARLENRLAAQDEAAEPVMVVTKKSTQKRAWYWLAAACLLLAFGTIKMLRVSPEQPTNQVAQQKPAHQIQKAPATIQTTPKEVLQPYVPQVAVIQEDVEKTSTLPQNRKPNTRHALNPTAQAPTAQVPVEIAQNIPQKEEETVTQPQPQTHQVETATATPVTTQSPVATVAQKEAETDPYGIASITTNPQSGVSVAHNTLGFGTRHAQRDSLHKGQKVRQNLLNKLNRALQWLPGGSAWPSIRFERGDVAVADAKPIAKDPFEPAF
jgi:hypothetical protein